MDSGRIQTPELHEVRILGEEKLKNVRLKEKAGRIAGWTIQEKPECNVDRMPDNSNFLLEKIDKEDK